MGNYPDGMTQQDHDREFDREPDDEPEKFQWYEFYDVVITIRARSKAEAIEMLDSVSQAAHPVIDIDIEIDKIVEIEE